VATHTLRKSPGHPFYHALNRELDAHGFDEFARRAPLYAPAVGRPSLTTGC